MSKLSIMLVCSAGMSTSLLVSKMQQYSKDNSIDADIFAVSANEADAHIASKSLDVILLGPQVRFLKNQFEKKVEGKDISVGVIDMKDYGTMNGEKVMNTAVEMTKQ